MKLTINGGVGVGVTITMETAVGELFLEIQKIVFTGITEVDIC